MGETCSCMHYEQESSDYLVPKIKSIQSEDIPCLLVSYEAQLALQTSARSFLYRKKLIPLLTEYHSNKSSPTRAKLPYPYSKLSITDKETAVIKTIESSLPSQLLNPSYKGQFYPCVVLPGGILYEGEWNTGRMARQGIGKELLKNGSKYIGEYVDDLKGVRVLGC